MTLETYIRAQLARVAIEHGARYGGVSNMLAVTMVLRNRVFAGWGSWLDVVTQVNVRPANVEIPSSDTTLALRSGNARILLNRVDEVYSRADLEDITGGALFWVDPSMPITPWFQSEILDRQQEHRRVAHIGPVWFFQ